MGRAGALRFARDGAMCFIPVPFDPKPVFGNVKPLERLP